jgi:hypothetical protein
MGAQVQRRRPDRTLLLEKTVTISSFGEDEAGNRYLADFSTGDINSIGLL